MTGVQTCALPISTATAQANPEAPQEWVVELDLVGNWAIPPSQAGSVLRGWAEGGVRAGCRVVEEAGVGPGGWAGRVAASFLGQGGRKAPRCKFWWAVGPEATKSRSLELFSVPGGTRRVGRAGGGHLVRAGGPESSKVQHLVGLRAAPYETPVLGAFLGPRRYQPGGHRRCRAPWYGSVAVQLLRERSGRARKRDL